MNTTVTMTLDDVRKLPTPTEEEILSIRNATTKKNDDPDCPTLSNEDLAEFRPLKDVKPELYAKLHPEWYKPKKVDFHMKIDADVLAWYKAQGKGYQTRINAILREHAFS